MKILDRSVVVLFTVCLIILSILLPVNVMATRDTYYRNQFKRCGIWPDENETVSVRYIGGSSSQTAELTESQLNDIISHITSFFKHEKSLFYLNLDDVKINGETVENVDIFGEKAVYHMEDVRDVFDTVKFISFVVGIITAACAVYMFLRKKVVRSVIYKASLVTVICFFGAFALFFLFVFIKHIASGYSFSADVFFGEVWTYMHHIFFPFSPDKFSGSFFNDTLTQLLTLDFFLNTVITIFVNLFAITAAWIFSAKLISKR